MYAKSLLISFGSVYTKIFLDFDFARNVRCLTFVQRENCYWLAIVSGQLVMEFDQLISVLDQLFFLTRSAHSE